MTCSIEGCGSHVHCRGWCSTHYRRWLRHGDPTVLKRPSNKGVPLLERFDAKWQQNPDTGCWEWTGARNDTGYGIFGVAQGELVRAHRFMYGRLIGPIPDGLVLDHLCRNPACINPAHLEPVTQMVNYHRGETNAAKTHCKHGHEFTVENTRIRHNGGGRFKRQCRTCERAQKAARAA